MKVVYAKFYQGARIGGVVRTHLEPKMLGFQGMELKESLGLIINFKKHTTNATGHDITVDETILVPLNNIAYCEVAQPEATKDKKPKAV